MGGASHWSKKGWRKVRRKLEKSRNKTRQGPDEVEDYEFTVAPFCCDFFVF